MANKKGGGIINTSSLVIAVANGKAILLRILLLYNYGFGWTILRGFFDSILMFSRNLFHFRLSEIIIHLKDLRAGIHAKFATSTCVPIHSNLHAFPPFLDRNSNSYMVLV
jgi:hypothetical protein